MAIPGWLLLTLGDVCGHTSAEQGNAACFVPNITEGYVLNSTSASGMPRSNEIS